MTKRIYIGLGSNIGDRQSHLAYARAQISERIGPIVQASSIYRTAPWGKTDQADFLNQVVAINTDLGPFRVLHHILEIEQARGRLREEKWGSRTLDLDLLFYSNYRIHTRELVIPHPELAQRNFVLVPLSEIAPNFIHPVLHIPLSDLLAESKDQGGVKIEKM